MDFPQRFGKYTLLKRLATGGMAEIFLAHQRGLGGFEKEVVVKRLLPEHAQNEELVAMFLDEARIAAHLTHPNIAQIYDLGAIEDGYFIAMEYVRGVDLRRLCSHGIAVNNYLPLNHAVRIMAEVCDALAYAHTRTDTDGRPMNIVHRDVSPTNILVTYDGGVKLVDFGIAKAANKATVTRSGQVKGKFGYMAPEQARGDEVDARTDLFAVGINLYEITVGQRLFKGGTDLETLEQVEHCHVPPPRHVDARFPEGLERVIMRALAKGPDDRYPSARDMQMALEEFLAGAGLRSTAGMLAGYMRHIFRDQLALEADEASRLRALVRSLPPEEPAARRPAFRDASTEVTAMPAFAGASLGERPSFDLDDDATAVSHSASAMQALLGGAPAPVEEEDNTASLDGPMPGVGVPSPRPQPVAQWSAPAPAAPPVPQARPQYVPQAPAPVAAPAPPQPAAAAPVQWPGQPPVAQNPWSALNAAPTPAPLTTPAPARVWAPPPESAPVGGDDISIKPPRSYTGLLMLLLVAVGAGALYWVMQQELDKPEPTGQRAAFDLQPRSLDDVLGKHPAAPEVAPPKRTVVRLTSEPPGARVVVNGNVLPELTPTAVQAFEGRWTTVRMILPGYLPAEKRVEVKPDTQAIDLALEKGSPPTGSLYVDSAPQGAEVTLNGQAVGVTPLKLPKVAALTELTLQVLKEGYDPHVVTYTVSEGKQG
ncbi:MAG: serine/threonine protein kinase, partial [Myxococcales bacterium]|nr:serine/threonine protein kinase [Myxococcales bacterium]